MGENDIDMSSVVKLTIDGKEVKQITDSHGRILWKKEDPLDYFYFEDLSGSANTLTCPLLFTDQAHPMNEWIDDMEYSTNKVTWNNWDLTTSITIPANGRVYLRSNCGSLCKNVGGGGYQGYHTFISTGNVYAGGNIVSLIDKSIEKTNLNTGRTFEHTFQDMTTLVEVSPTLCDTITGLSGTYNFNRTWFGCTNLTNIPNFSGITEATSSAFNSTFRGTAITDVSNLLPNLTTISGGNTFNSTFRDCQNISVGLNLLGVSFDENAANSCLTNMYYSCSNLTIAYAPNINDWSLLSETNNWLYNVSASGTLYVPTQELATTIPRDNNSGCPTGWTVQVLS